MVPRVSIIVVAVGIAAVYATPAGAQCDSAGHGAPGIADITSTSSSFTVSWLLLCSLVPTRIEIRQDGTAQRSWQDGTLLGSISLAPLMNGGGVTASHLTANKSFLNLRLCSVYTAPDFESLCTAPFGAQTSGSGSGPTGPFNVKANYSSKPVGVMITWTAGANVSSYEVIRLLLTFHSGGWQSSQQQSFTGIHTTSLLDSGASPLAAYQYEVIAQNQSGASMGWSNQLFPGPAPQPAPPLRAPTSLHASWSGGTQIVVTWVPAVNDPASYLNVYHRVGIAPLLDTGASPWVPVASRLNVRAASFSDTRPHVPPERHVYKVCAVSGVDASKEVCSTPVGATP